MFYFYPEEKGHFLGTLKEKKEYYLHTVDVTIQICFQS